MAKKIKCDGSNAEFCDALSDRLEDHANATRKGLVLMVAMNITTGGRRVVGVCFKRGAKDGGLMLNICPFCGERIDHGFNR